MLAGGDHQVAGEVPSSEVGAVRLQDSLESEPGATTRANRSQDITISDAAQERPLRRVDVVDRKSTSSPPTTTWLQAFFRLNGRWSNAFDELLPPETNVVGIHDFTDSIVPQHLEGVKVAYDVGGGKRPLIDAHHPLRSDVRHVGIDVDADELYAAPTGTYDERILADITSYRGHGDGDLVICRTVLEHVDDAQQALTGIVSLLRPGGKALLFLPSREALFTKLNLFLPETIKKYILFYVFPGRKQSGGFKAYYDRATPQEYLSMCDQVGLVVDQSKKYYKSGYFKFFAPLYIVWRLYKVVGYWIKGDDMRCEAFAIVAHRKVG